MIEGLLKYRRELIEEKEELLIKRMAFSSRNRNNAKFR